jgi:hypothetical protein
VLGGPTPDQDAPQGDDDESVEQEASPLEEDDEGPRVAGGAEEGRPLVLGYGHVRAQREQHHGQGQGCPRLGKPASQGIDNGHAHIIMIIGIRGRAWAGPAARKQFVEKDQKGQESLVGVSGEQRQGDQEETHLDALGGALQIEGNSMEQFEAQEDGND